MNNYLGTRIKILREEKELSQLELARKLNISNSTLSQYEAGNRIPGDDIKNKIADYFNVSVDFLLGRTDERNPYIRNNTKSPEEKYPEIHDVEDAMKVILEQPGLMLKGEILSDESKIILANAIQMGLRTAEELEKKKRANKGDDNE